ncbi:MAG: InlB B-repeat-containing protein [Lachnospiraceae bacterium]
MNKNLSKLLAFMLTMVLSMSMTMMPVVQAASIENSQVETSIEESDDSLSTVEETEKVDNNLSVSEEATEKSEDNLSIAEETTEESEDNLPIAEETTEESENNLSTAEEATEEVDNIQSITSKNIAEGSCGESLTWYLTDTGKLYINGTGEMDDYNDGAPWQQYQEDIIEVYLNGETTYIGDRAFYNCSSLSEIVIPEGVLGIGKSAFENCDSLRKITILNPECDIHPDYYDEKLDKECQTISTTAMICGYDDSTAQVYAKEYGRVFESLGEAPVIEKKVAEGTCGESLTWYLTDTGKLYINGTGSMENYNYNSNKNAPWEQYQLDIEKVYLNTGVTYIGNQAFYGCSNLEEVNISESVKNIGSFAFGECDNLTEVIIPDGMEKIGDEAFAYCERLSEVAIPDSVTSIGKGAFEMCKNLSNITISNAMTSIENFTFRGCANLSTVFIPDSVTSIGAGVFEECESLSEIVIPETLTNIGDGAFYGCASLNEIIIPDGVTSINDGTYWGCTSLSEVIIPKTVTSIGYEAFGGCSNLSKITILNPNCVITPDEYGEDFGEEYQTISSTATIYGYSNSTAQAYAKKHNRAFKALTVPSYTVTYDANKGQNAPSSQKKYENKILTLSNTKPTRTGYTFVGWATSSESTTVSYVPGASFNENKDITLYAVWKANIYKISFNKNGGTAGDTKRMSCAYDKEYSLRENGFTRTGYEFIGWATSSTGAVKYKDAQKIKNLGTKQDENVTLYAKWTKRYTITYQLNGGTNSKENPSSYITGSEIILKNPTKKGYIFKGWYVDSNYKTKVTKIENKATGNKIFYAKWEAISYTITYELNGGTNHKENPASYITSKEVVLKNPTKKGYTFKGWYLDAEYTKKAESIEKGSTGDKKFYAKWQINKYKIVFNKNGGTGTMKEMSCNYNKEYSLAKNEFTRTGYEFIGWATSSTGAVKYKNAQKIKNLSSQNGKVITFYAKWEAIPYTITYELNGGTNHKENPASYITSKEVVLKNPTKKGYTFKGWYLDAEYTKKAESIEKGSTGDKKFYAKWQINKYKIVFNKNGGTGTMKEMSCNYNKEYSLAKNEFTRTGYEFIGWATSSTGAVKYKNAQKIKNLSSQNGKVITFYAKWKKK